MFLVFPEVCFCFGGICCNHQILLALLLLTHESIIAQSVRVPTLWNAVGVARETFSIIGWSCLFLFSSVISVIPRIKTFFERFTQSTISCTILFQKLSKLIWSTTTNCLLMFPFFFQVFFELIVSIKGLVLRKGKRELCEARQESQTILIDLTFCWVIYDLVGKCQCMLDEYNAGSRGTGELMCHDLILFSNSWRTHFLSLALQTEKNNSVQRFPQKTELS